MKLVYELHFNHIREIVQLMLLVMNLNNAICEWCTPVWMVHTFFFFFFLDSNTMIGICHHPNIIHCTSNMSRLLKYISKIHTFYVHLSSNEKEEEERENKWRWWISKSTVNISTIHLLLVNYSPSHLKKIKNSPLQKDSN